MGFEKALEHAILTRRFCIRDKLTSSAETAKSSMDDCASDSSIESSKNDSSEDKSIASEFDICTFVNDKLDAENVSGDARTNKGLELFWIILDVVSK